MKSLRQNKMTSAERLKALLNGHPIDRVPFVPFGLSCGAPGFCARNAGYPVTSIYDDPEKSFWSQVWTQEQYGCEGFQLFGYASYGCWEFGGEVKFPTDEWEQAPSIKHHPVVSEEDIAKLELPDVKVSGILPSAMRFSGIQAQSDMPITLFLVSPFTCAGNIAGIGKLSRWLIKKPEIAHQLLKIATAHLLHVSRYWLDVFGSERILVHNVLPMESNQLISPKQFKDFAFPYLKEVHEKVLSWGVKRFSTHICGDHNLNLPYLAGLPMGENGIVSFGHEVDIAKSIEHFGDKCIIAGNLDPRIIQTGTPQQIYDISRQCIEKGKHSPRGYIFSPGCDVPVLAPAYNIYVMGKAVNDFGWYTCA